MLTSRVMECELLLLSAVPVISQKLKGSNEIKLRVAAEGVV